MARKGGLGMGLDALFDDNASLETQAKQTLRLSEMEPNKDQPRNDFDEQSIANLADSIREHGLLQPILVRPLENGSYQIVAGERRWRACRMLGMSEVPVIIRELDDFQTAKIALVENLQREDLNPIDEAMGYDHLMQTYQMTQDAVARLVGRSRSTIANALRLLVLPEPVRGMLRSGDITAGHAKALAAVKDTGKMLELAQKAANGSLSVRQMEAAASKAAEEDQEQEEDELPLEFGKDSFYREMQLALENTLGRKVKVSSGKGKGMLELEFYGQEDLKRLAFLLTRDKDMEYRQAQSVGP